MKIFKLISWLIAISLLSYGIIQSCKIYDWTGLAFFPYPYQYYLVPGIAALVSACILSCFSKWRPWHLGHIIASTCLILYFGLYSFAILGVFVSIPTTRISNYQKVFEDLSHWSDIADYFPGTVPEYATNVKFYFEPGCLQGRGLMMLRYNTPAEKIESYYQKFSNMQPIPWQNIDQDYSARLNRLIDINKLKDDYDLLQHKIIISRKKNEIIYFANP